MDRYGNGGGGLLAGMNLEAGAKGDNIDEIKQAPLVRRALMAPISLLAAEAGMEAGVMVEDFLAGFFDDPEDKYRRAKILIGKMVAAILIYPFSAPAALGFSASGGILHLVTGWSTVAELNDQAVKRMEALKAADVQPASDDTASAVEEKYGRNTKRASEEKKEAAQASPDVEQQVLNPDVIAVYGQAADKAFDALVAGGFAAEQGKKEYRSKMSQAVKDALAAYQERQAA